MGEGLKNNPDRREQLKDIVKNLNEGTNVSRVKKDFDRLIRHISPEEIADIEQSLITEGVPVEHVQKLCDVHVQVFDEALKKQKSSKVLPGHPVHSYKQENKELRKRIRRLTQGLKKGLDEATLALEDLQKIEIHYARKENQLFPYLETVGFTGPSKVMWGKHDDIRNLFRALKNSLQDGTETKKTAAALVKALKNMVFMEERILFPTALRKLPPEAWVHIRRGETAIGYCWIEPGNLWDANIMGARARGTTDSDSRKEQAQEGNPLPAAGSGPVPLDTGALSPAQINLLLKNLPFDITFVDENGKVAYYSEGKERIFPRSPGIIGRDVANCHPPKSVHIVEKVIESLKNREQDAAEFWIQIHGQFVYIRYFALFDHTGAYKGIIEVSQEISHIRELTGEKRLLDW
ncbi:MAG: DUF438 domain-containing protein [Spirochaetales bacterium]|nr:DUF438 domain-containing protein [Spirochaetales bacterium]